MKVSPPPKPLIDRIREVRIPHRNYEEAANLVRSYLTFANDGTIIMMLGPQKVGKTALISDITSEYPPDGDLIPLVVTDATTIGSSFSMLHLTYRYLAELGHPLFSIDSIENWKRSAGTKISETNARIILENGLRLRQTIVVALDECQQMVCGIAENKALHALESMKCMVHPTRSKKYDRGVSVPATQSRRLGWMSGTYETLDEDFTSIHFKNRIAPVHLRRYKETKEDVHEFARAFASLQPIVEAELGRGVQLIIFVETVFHGTFGCFGKAVNWLLLAIALKNARNDRTLRIAHFEETQLQISLEGTLESILKGEEIMERICKNFYGFDQSSTKSPKVSTSKRVSRGKRTENGHRYKVPKGKEN